MSTVLLRWKMFWYYQSLEVSTTLIFYYHMFLLDFILKKAQFQANKKKKKTPRRPDADIDCFCSRLYHMSP